MDGNKNIIATKAGSIKRVTFRYNISFLKFYIYKYSPLFKRGGPKTNFRIFKVPFGNAYMFLVFQTASLYFSFACPKPFFFWDQSLNNVSFQSEVTIKKRNGSKRSSRETEPNNNVMKDNSQNQCQRTTKPQTYLMEECSNRKDIEEALLKDAFETLNLKCNTW